MWIFGYGSLTWKADFSYQKRVVGYIKGYCRRFWQASVDHRGVPEKPGRVVTLVPGDFQDVVWGAAYEVEDSLLEAGSALNIREKTYQERREEIVYTADGLPLPEKAVVFVGTNQEQLRLGPAPLEDIATQIASSQGPSGHNSQYLLNLANFMHDEVPCCKDEHLFKLEALVLEAISKNGEGT